MIKFLLAALLCLVWGSTWLGIKIGLEDSPPFLSAGFRFVISCAVLFALIRWKKLSLATSFKDWKNIVIPGLFAYFFSYGLVYWGEQHINSGLAAVLFSTLPFWVAIFAHLLLPNEKFNRVKLVSLVIGFSGILLIFWDNLRISSGQTVLGMLALLGSGASAAYAGVRTKRDLHHVDPIVIAAQQMLVGMVLLLLGGFALEDLHTFKITQKSIGALFYLAIFGSALAFSVYFYLLKTTDATKLSLIAFVTPIVALILGWLIMNEKVTRHLLLGAGLVIVGIVLLVFWGKAEIPLED